MHKFKSQIKKLEDELAKINKMRKYHNNKFKISRSNSTRTYERKIKKILV
jgi:hypothetical protein